MSQRISRLAVCLIVSSFLTLTLLVAAYSTDAVNMLPFDYDMMRNRPPSRHHRQRPSSTTTTGGSLTTEDFDKDVKSQGYHNAQQESRFESIETWRDPDAITDSVHLDHASRPKSANLQDYSSKGSYLHQPIVSDYPPGAEKIFFLIKTGGTELWNKLPVHLFASLPKMPKFAFYSDSPGSIGGYEVIDILANLTQERRESELFEMYRLQREIHDNHGIYDYSESKLNNAWHLDKFKNVPAFRHAYLQSPDSDWFFMMDADSYVMVDNLVEWLKGRNPNKPYYHGSIIGNGIQFAHGGSGILVSRKALEMSVGSSNTDILDTFEARAAEQCCGDAVFAQMIYDHAGELRGTTGEKDTAHRPFQGNAQWDVEVTPVQWCQRILTFHHVSPHDIEILYEYERLKGPQQRRSVTYGDIYRDFFHPYLQDEIANWDNNAKDTVYDATHHPDDKAWQSLADCKEACQQDSECMTYRYVPEEQKCGLSHSIRLGRPTHKHLDFKYDQDSGIRQNLNTTSGWMLDRIRQVRKNSHCDIYASNPAQTNDQGEDRSEGWWLRKVQHERPAFVPGLTQY